jgi:DNA-binding MltR family transcriptional regulator
LENRGPLQVFGARIQIAFAIGIYGRHAYEDLCIVKDIRNAFAHSADAMDFSHSDVAERCKDF